MKFPVTIPVSRGLRWAVAILLLAGGGLGAAALSGVLPAGALPGWMDIPALVRRPYRLTVPIPSQVRGLPLPVVQGPKDASRPLVVIDAGHGGRDPGASNAQRGYREKDVTLALALAVRDALLQGEGGRVRVALTRSDDRYLTLEQRYAIARALGADLFLSIHADAADNPAAEGATVYTLSETASDREAARLAARENRADVVNGVAMGDQGGAVPAILIDLSRREAMKLAADFADVLHREAAADIPFRGRYHRFASLVVLKAPDVPSALFEAGYISNAGDAARLSAPEGRQRIARGLARAITTYFARRTTD